ncbi:MAG: hemolysin family protein [Acidobacteriota bacterium]
MEYEIALTGILVVMLVFIATFESAFWQLSEVALRSLAAENKSKTHASFLRHLVEHRQLYWLTVISGLQFATVLLSILIASIVMRLAANSGLSHIGIIALAFATTMALVILFRQFLPRLFTQNKPVRVMLLLLPAFEIYYQIFSIPAQLVYRTLLIFREERTIPPENIEDKSGDEIKALLDVGAEEGIIEEEESEMIHSVIEFGDRRVDEVMTPRTEIVALDASATIEQMRDLMVESNHSRVPIYHDSIDNMEGIVYIHDVMAAWSNSQTKAAVSTISRPAYFVPETKPVAELLREMQHAKTQIALVVDEYGVTAGLITIEDLIEEIVGEIEEEDVEKSIHQEREIIETGDGSYLVKGSTEIRKVELLFGKELEADDFSTVAGFIIKNVGRVPNVGESFTYHGLMAEILEADSGRINRVRLRPTSATELEKTNGSAQ